MKRLRVLLFPFSLLLILITELRNLLYRTKVLKASRFDLPLISIGNLSTGGTGKSPHTSYLLSLLENEYKTAVLSRGYGRTTRGYREVKLSSQAGETGDEPLQCKLRHPETVVAVGENRVQGVIRLMRIHPYTQVVLLDDAYQHRAIQPGLSILLTEYALPFYEDYVLPVGNLREMRHNAKRADIVVVTKCPELSTAQKEETEARIARYTDAPVFFSHFTYGPLKSVFHSGQEASPLGQPVALFTGIANPLPLEEFLRSTASSVQHLRFGDHHRFTAKDIGRITDLFDSFANKETLLITTEKDAMRLRALPDEIRDALHKLPLYYQPVSVVMQEEKKFTERIQDYVSTTLRNL